MINFLKEFLSVISHVLNVLTGGSRFYTFSARTHYCSQVLKLKNWNYIEKAINMLFFWQEAHCKQEFERERHQRWAPY